MKNRNYSQYVFNKSGPIYSLQVLRKKTLKYKVEHNMLSCNTTYDLLTTPKSMFGHHFT